MNKQNIARLFILSVLVAVFVTNVGTFAFDNDNVCFAADSMNFAENELPLASCDIIDDIGDLVTGTKPAERGEEVYLGGFPLGLTIDGNGVTVIGLNEFFDEEDRKSVV